MKKDRKFSIICDSLNVGNKVEVIKALRWLTDMGLKEAIDAIEIRGRQVFKIDGKILQQPDSDNLITEQFHILRRCGIVVDDTLVELLDSLRRVGAEALTLGEDELANEIMQLVLAEKLRRREC